MSSLLSKLFQVCVNVATFTIRLAFSLEPPRVCMSLCKICLLQERNVHVSYMSRQYLNYGAITKVLCVAIHCACRGLAGDCGLLGESQRSAGLPNASPVCLRVPMVISSRTGRNSAKSASRMHVLPGCGRHTVAHWCCRTRQGAATHAAAHYEIGSLPAHIWDACLWITCAA